MSFSLTKIRNCSPKKNKEGGTELCCARSFGFNSVDSINCRPGFSPLQKKEMLKMQKKKPLKQCVEQNWKF